MPMAKQKKYLKVSLPSNASSVAAARAPIVLQHLPDQQKSTANDSGVLTLLAQIGFFGLPALEPARSRWWLARRRHVEQGK